MKNDTDAPSSLQNRSGDIQDYVAVIRSDAVRDVQYAPQRNPNPASDDWRDADLAEIFLGIYHMSYEAAMTQAAQYAGIDPDNIALYSVSEYRQTIETKE